MRKNLNRMFNPFVIIFCIWFLLMGCAANKIQIKIQERVPAKSEEFFTAGVAKVDITPPPGYPMGGFSIAGKFSRGWWTRLYAKSIYLQDRPGNRLVLVSADLWAFPAGLADKICQVISEKEPALRLGREEIVFAATHTHHSPGNYSSSSAYTLQLGKRFGRGIWEAQQNADMKLEGIISNAFKYVVIKDKSVETDFVEPGDTLCQPNPVFRTSKKSVPGVSALGGAENGRTIFFDFGFREGVIDDECNGRQGAKKFTGKQVFEEFLHIDTGEPINKMLLQWIKNILSGQGPREIPLGVHSLGSVTFATLPGEFTFTLGHRIKNRLKKEHSETAEIILIGPANEYLSYFTTPSEFNAQHYEGAMTLYGQFSGTYVKQELAKLARLSDDTTYYKLNREYKVGSKVHKDFGRIREGDHWNMEEALKNILQDHRTGAVHVRFPQVAWTDRVIHLSEVMDLANRSVNPVVSVERQQAQNRYSLVESDTNSVNFVCLIHAVTGNTAHWRAIWMTSSEEDSTQAMRFKIGLPSGGTLYSADFRLEDYASKKPIPLPSDAKKP